MNLNKVVFRFVSISFSILVILLVLIGFVKIGTYCYDFGYRVFTEAPVDAEPGRDVIVQISDDMSDMDIAKELKEKGLVENAKLFFVQLKVSAYSGSINLATVQCICKVLFVNQWATTCIDQDSIRLH